MENIAINIIISNKDHYTINQYPICIYYDGIIDNEDTLKEIVIHNEDIVNYINNNIISLNQWCKTSLFCRCDKIDLEISVQDCIQMRLPKVICAINNLVNIKDGPILIDIEQDVTNVPKSTNVNTKKRIIDMCRILRVQNYYPEFYNSLLDQLIDEEEIKKIVDTAKISD